MRYRMFAKSAPGPKYVAMGWGCQDCSAQGSFDGGQVIAVADGHGSSDCFRSQVGAALAVRAAIEQAKLACKGAGSESFSDTGINNFKYQVWCEWRRLVKEDWEHRLSQGAPLGEGEVRFESVSEKYKERFTSTQRDVVERYLYTAYGTTLLWVVVIESQILLLQIGDGTCVVLRRDGKYCTPVPDEEENFLNVTVSLCGENASSKIRHCVLDRHAGSPTEPIAVFLSSDGVDDCFPIYMNELHLFKLYTLIIENVLESGFDATESEIEQELLPDLTSRGSHDDISLAYLICDDLDTLRQTYEQIDSAHKPTPKAVELERETPGECGGEQETRSGIVRRHLCRRACRLAPEDLRQKFVSKSSMGILRPKCGRLPSK